MNFFKKLFSTKKKEIKSESNEEANIEELYSTEYFINDILKRKLKKEC